MPKRVERKVTILIPRDPLNKEIDAVRFQRDGVDFYVPVGKMVEVPLWVKEAAIQSKHIEED